MLFFQNYACRCGGKLIIALFFVRASLSVDAKSWIGTLTGDPASLLFSIGSLDVSTPHDVVYVRHESVVYVTT